MGFDTPAATAVRRYTFASDMQATVVLPAVAADLVLPSVTIGAGQIAGGITRVTAGISWRKQVESSTLANALAGAQDIQVRSDAPGTFIDAINLADNSLATGASATEGGTMIVGDIDVKGEVDGADTYEFQWDEAVVDGASLTLHDVQTFLFVEAEA